MAQTPDMLMEMDQMITGSVLSQAIGTAAELGVADLLAEGERSAGELAAATEAHPDALHRILRFLASHGLFEEQGGRFSLTPKGALLRSDVPNSKRDAARLFYRCAPALSEMVHSARTSEAGWVKAHGKPIFEHLSERPEEAAVFDSAMVSIHGGETQAVLDSYDYSGIEVLADIGGGNGSVLGATLAKYPELRGHWFDLPHVEDRARETFRHAGVDGRCELTSGNFFEAVAGGADAYQMRHIIHDWYDDRAGTILGNVRSVIPEDGKLLLIETVVPTDSQPSPAKLFDIVMLMVPGGLERTEEQFRSLFQASGFELTSVTPTASPVCVIEGRPV